MQSRQSSVDNSMRGGSNKANHNMYSKESSGNKLVVVSAASPYDNEESGQLTYFV